ncbi:cytochrome P450 [Nonomuraea spiralis]|uniref:Cytochrome P450 n=1 Tax=Nonomuraea spiralis TaxID=46182 RepID=A0ABV5IFA0_9ACTN|nr:cytochrome P450 [Nonomuraea spiralis]
MLVLLSLPYWLPRAVTALRVWLFARINGTEGVPVPGDLVDVSRFLEVYGHPAARGRSRGAALSDLFWYWLSPGADVHQEHLEPGPRHAEVAACTRRVLTLPSRRAASMAVESLRAAPPPADRRLVRLRDLAMPVWAEFYHRLVFGEPCPPGVRELIVAHADDVVTSLKCCGLRHMDRRLRLTAYLESSLDRVPHLLPASLSRREQAYYLQGTFFNTAVVQSSEATAHALMVAATEGRGEGDGPAVGELIEETLRRFPLFGVAHRVTYEDIGLGRDSVIPAGSVLCFNYPEFHAKGGNIPFGVPTNRPCPAWHLAPLTVQAVVAELLGAYTFTTWAAHTRSLPNRGPCLMTPHGQAARLRLPLLAYLRVRDRWEEVTRSIAQLVLGTYMVWDARRLRLCERHFLLDEKGNHHDPAPRRGPRR